MTEKEPQEGSPWRSFVNMCCDLRGQFYHFNTIKLEQQLELQRHGGSWEWVDLRGDLHAVNTVMMALRATPGQLAQEEQREPFHCEQYIWRPYKGSGACFLTFKAVPKRTLSVASDP